MTRRVRLFARAPHGALSWARLLAALVASLLVSGVSAGCERCSPPEREAAIATLSTLTGSGVVRDFAKAPLTWQAASLGATLALGDGAKTDAKSTAELTFIDGATLALEANTTVRLLLDSNEKQTGFDVQSGQAVLHVGKAGLNLRTHVGMAMIAPNSEILLRRNGDSLGFDVALGRLNFRDRNAAAVDLESGDSVDVGIGMAVLELKRKADDTTPTTSDLHIEVVSGEVRSSGPAGIFPRTLGAGQHSVIAGTHLKLPAGSEVIVKRGSERVHLRGAGEFIVGVEKALAESRRGAMRLEAMEVDVEVRVPGGVIVARSSPSGTRAEVTVGERDGQLKVLRGSVSSKLYGHEEELKEGDLRAWDLASGGAATGEDAVNASTGPVYRHMLVGAGTSFVVHTPSAPVAVGFAFNGKCPGEAQLELVGTKQKSRGDSSANLLFPVGSRGYLLRCIGDTGKLGKIAARGNVQVLVDAGTRKLPPRAPTSNIDADGRTYSIYYQNQLPEVAVRWPNAPVQPKYQLELDGKPIELSAPEHLFRSGTLGDGTHALIFQAQGRRSRTTTVEVHFDNVAPKASLSAPDDRSYKPGDMVTVEGVALPTWKVALDGGSIVMSGGDRFSGQVQTSTERPDVAVRLSHPRLGTHYYLRRASGSP
jgi:hypothetical protein